MNKINLNEYVNLLEASDQSYQPSKRRTNENLDEKIDNINDMLLKTEQQKYIFRKKIVLFVGAIIVAQLIFFDYVVYLVIDSIISKNDMLRHLTSMEISYLLSFLKYYISATVVELLGMLFFIIRYAFSGIEDKKKYKKKKNK